MKIRWEVEDGYVGKSRPQQTVIPDDEIAQCNTPEERERLIEDYVREDFQNKISYTILGEES